jgi:DNA-binding transcriptional regulator YhcF (GntR family)
MNHQEMKTILETDSDFICDIQQLCFLMLLPEIFQLPSLKDFADFAGISTENAVKLLKMFEKEGLIDLNEKDIIIVKQAALLEISRRG